MQYPVFSTPDRKEKKAESKEPERRNKIKWPKANKAEAWHTLDVLTLLKSIWEALRRGAESRHNIIGDIIYQTCKDRFGEITPSLSGGDHPERKGKERKGKPPAGAKILASP